MEVARGPLTLVLGLAFSRRSTSDTAVPGAAHAVRRVTPLPESRATARRREENVFGGIPLGSVVRVGADVTCPDLGL